MAKIIKSGGKPETAPDYWIISNFLIIQKTKAAGVLLRERPLFEKKKGACPELESVR